MEYNDANVYSFKLEVITSYFMCNYGTAIPDFESIWISGNTFDDKKINALINSLQ